MGKIINFDDAVLKMLCSGYTMAPKWTTLRIIMIKDSA